MKRKYSYLRALLFMPLFLAILFFGGGNQKAFGKDIPENILWLLPSSTLHHPFDTLGGNMILPLSQPIVIAHRGDSKHAPENTLPAFKRALRFNPEMIELDYHGKDFVVIHDETFDRTTDAVKKWGHSDNRVTSHTLAQIKTLDAGIKKGPEFEKTRVPTLKESMDVIQRSSFTLIERKEGEPKDLFHFLKKEGWETDVVVQSFDWDFIRDIREYSNAISCGALGPPWGEYKGQILTEEEKWLNEEFIDDIASRGARFVAWNNWVTTKSIALAHKKDLRVLIYTIDDPDEAERLVKLGVDGIITNDPETIAKRLRS